MLSRSSSSLRRGAVAPLLRSAPSPTAYSPTLPRPSARAFSLWPSSSSSSTTAPPSALPDAASPPSPPLKPTLSDLFSPTSLPDPTFFEPASSLFLSLPPALHLSYAAFIPLFTLFYRSTTTLPITLWQRRRTRKFTEVVLPLVRKEQGRIALETRDECRRAGKSYEEYQKVFEKKAKTAALSLARQHRCSPRLTLFLPPLTHIPIFITATLILRDACARATAALAISPENLPSLLTASPTSLLNHSALQHLHDLASTPFLWCPSLVLPDPTMFLPLAVGVAALLNIEVTAQTRRAAVGAVGAVEEPQPDVSAAAASPAGPGAAPTGGMPVVSAAQRRRLVASRARDGLQPSARQFSSSPSTLLAVPPRPGGPIKADVGAGVFKGKLQQRVVTNMLRVAAVAFIPLAGMAPSAVCIYWVTSNLFTLAQNLAFWWLDRGKEKERRMRAILSGKAVGV
ncbi:hypothetical protein JCM11251_001623 [Rhodosporidiobolus azoricus]